MLDYQKLSRVVVTGKKKGNDVSKETAAAMLAALNAASPQSGGNVQYISKDGDIRVKLVLTPGLTETNWFVPFENIYKGDRKTAFLVPVVIVGGDDKSIVNKDKVKYLKLPPTAIKGIINLFDKDWELFSDDGPIVSITRGKGKNGVTEFVVTNAPGKFAQSKAEVPEQTIHEAAEDQQKRSFEKAGISATPSVSAQLDEEPF